MGSESERPGNGRSSREDSSNFSETIVQHRSQYLSERKKAWFQALPVRRIIPTMYRALYSSKHLLPFQLVSLGNTLLRFLKEQVDTTAASISGIDYEHQKYLQMFDEIFSRLLTIRFDEGDGFQELLDSVWNFHKNGIIDFSKTSIPEKLVQVCPERLEQVLQICLTSSGSPTIDLSDGSPAPLVPLCERSPENFTSVMEHLQGKLSKSSDPVIRQKITDFVLEFLELLKSKLKVDYFSLFPSSFQPLLHFMNILSLSDHTGSQSSRGLIDNANVVDEIFNLLDTLYYQSELMQLDITTVTFMLCTCTEVSKILVRRKSCDMISYRRWPYLKRALKTDEFTHSCNQLLDAN